MKSRLRELGPRPNLGLSIPANMGEARLGTLEDTRIDDWVGLPSSSVSSINNRSPTRSASSSGKKSDGVPAEWSMVMGDGRW